MSIRQSLNNHPTVATICAVVLLAACLGLIAWQVLGSDQGTWREDTYFYDLNTKEVFIAAHRMTRIETPSGSTEAGRPAGVSARIFACGSCKDIYAGMTPTEIEETGAALTFIQRPGDAGQGAGNGERQGVESAMPPELGYHTEVARPGELNWAKIMSRRGQQIMKPDLECPDGSSPEPCYPGG